ncbi:DUF3592 domain-containing protein [Pseudonocardia nigra]|uniref:DUF3592 domain-containing protein n=1 Tax=Pseudonocardia nigra TaxID=1921578 RepID=UPI001C5DB3A5|nr:DUF3592 domain-containing protein [Pseudonocardia nigra]
MTDRSPRERRSGGTGLCAPPVRHGLVLTAAVLVCCAVVLALCWASWSGVRDQLTGLTARAVGTVTETEVGGVADTVRVRWQPAGGAERVLDVRLGGSVPPVGSRTEVAYDPADPTRATVPGSAAIVDGNRALTDAFCVAVVAIAVLVLGGVRWWFAAAAVRRRPRRIAARRVRIQSGLLSRSWLETEHEPQRWVPVHFDPLLVTLPAPTTVTFLGDPLRDSWVGAEIDGRRIYPAGRVRTSEPRGRRVDNPMRPDADTARRARRATLGRHLLLDAALVAPAPLVGLFWAYLDGGGLSSWAGATAIAAVVGLWTGAYRGSDPS